MKLEKQSGSPRTTQNMTSLPPFHVQPYKGRRTLSRDVFLLTKIQYFMYKIYIVQTSPVQGKHI